MAVNMGEGIVGEVPISSFELCENKILELPISRAQRVIVEFPFSLTEHSLLWAKSLTGSFAVEDTDNFNTYTMFSMCQAPFSVLYVD